MKKQSDTLFTLMGKQNMQIFIGALNEMEAVGSMRNHAGNFTAAE